MSNGNCKHKNNGIHCEVGKRRVELKLSRQRTADMLQVPYTTLCKWEAGETTLLGYYDRALTIELETLFRGKKLEAVLERLNVAEIDAHEDNLIEWLEELKDEIRNV